MSYRHYLLLSIMIALFWTGAVHATESQEPRQTLKCTAVTADGVLDKSIPLSATLDRVLIRNSGASKVTRITIGTAQGETDVMDTTSIAAGTAYNYKVNATIDGLVFHEALSTPLYVGSDGWNGSTINITWYLKR